jgi:hypothetical protein
VAGLDIGGYRKGVGLCGDGHRELKARRDYDGRRESADDSEITLSHDKGLQEQFERHRLAAGGIPALR